jgi:hypothetical protein
MTRYLLLFDCYGIVFVGHPLWWEDGSLSSIHCWPLPEQSFSGPSPLGLATISYCLRFETSLFVASLRLARSWWRYLTPPPHGYCFGSKSKSHCDWQSVSQSVSKSWCQAPSGAHDQIFITVWQLLSCFLGCPLWLEDEFVFCICCWPLPAQSFLGPSALGLAPIFYCLRFETSLFVASYDSQVHSGGIRPRLHTGVRLPWLCTDHAQKTAYTVVEKCLPQRCIALVTAPTT